MNSLKNAVKDTARNSKTYFTFNSSVKWQSGDRESNICPKVTKIGSIIGHRIVHNRVGR